MTFATVTKSLGVATALLAVALISPTSARASRSVTIQNIPLTPHQAPPGTPLVDIAEAVRMAAGSGNWDIIGETSGSMTARLRIRTHTAMVIIHYSESDYQIDYLNSINLDFNPHDLRGPKAGIRSKTIIKGPRIHANYNVWVRTLAESIEMYSLNPPKAAEIRGDASGDPIMIADELDKLDALRQRGVLTQQEFDRLKAKLLK